MVWSIRDLDDKGLGQNKILCSFSGVKLPIVNYYAGSLAALPALRRQISGYPPASYSRTALTWIPPYCLFFVVSFGALLSTSCRLSLFLLCGELDR